MCCLRRAVRSTRTFCGARVPQALAFLLDVRDEPAELLAAETPPRLAGEGASALAVPTLRGQAIRFELADALVAPLWRPVATSAVERLPWGSAEYFHSTPGTSVYLRAVAVPMP